MSSRKRALEFDRQWGDLARYNSEKARGIMHTPEWEARMVEKQAAYRAWLQEQHPDFTYIS